MTLKKSNESATINHVRKQVESELAFELVISLYNKYSTMTTISKYKRKTLSIFIENHAECTRLPNAKGRHLKTN